MRALAVVLTADVTCLHSSTAIRTNTACGSPFNSASFAATHEDIAGLGTEPVPACVLGHDAATAYRKRVGHPEVPRGHVETVVVFDRWRKDVCLGVWVTATRSRWANLPAERVEALDAIGMCWA